MGALWKRINWIKSAGVVFVVANAKHSRARGLNDG